LHKKNITQLSVKQNMTFYQRMRCRRSNVW